MDRIFISYRRTDSAGHTGRLHDRLVGHFGPDRTFLDIDHIEPGVDFIDTIDRTLGDCSIVLVVIGPRWLEHDDRGHRRIDNDADFHRLEVQRAIELERRIIPVLTGGAAMPRSADLPAPLRSLARRNAFELSDKRFSYDAGRLIDVIDRVFEQARPNPTASPSPAAGSIDPDSTTRRPQEQGTASPPPVTAEHSHEDSQSVGDRSSPADSGEPADAYRPLFSGFLLLAGGALLLFLASLGFRSTPADVWSWPSLVAGVLLVAMFVRWALGRASER